MGDNSGSYSNTYVAAPTGQTTQAMLGLAGVITPCHTGKILAIISGNVAPVSGDAVTMILSYGTGGAPSNAGAVTGTQTAFQAVIGGAAVTANPVGFTLTFLLAGAVLRTAYWFDLTQSATAGPANTNFCVTLLEM